MRNLFPILGTPVRGGKPLTYLDSAATTQKPESVLRALDRYYRETNANIHRGVHYLSERATIAFEDARKRISRFVGGADPRGVIFTRGTTEALNLVAHSLGASGRVARGDLIVLSRLEHHSNIVPWQLLAERVGAEIRVIPINASGDLELARYRDFLASGRVKVVSVAHVSNALGTINPVEEIVADAKRHGAVTVVDGAQAIAHLPVDVQRLGCDFYAFSGHKIYGPTGIGALIARPTLLETLPPWQGGGDMIRTVTFEKTTYAEIPARFEAGTPDIAGAIGLAAALDFVEEIGWPTLQRKEENLVAAAVRRLHEYPGLRIVGTPALRSGVVSFTLDSVHPHDVGTILDQEGIAVRTGHHCAQPVMDFYGVPATTRASFAVYNDERDVDALMKGLDTVRKVFRI